MKSYLKMRSQNKYQNLYTVEKIPSNEIVVGKRFVDFIREHPRYSFINTFTLNDFEDSVKKSYGSD